MYTNARKLLCICICVFYMLGLNHKSLGPIKQSHLSHIILFCRFFIHLYRHPSLLFLQRIMATMLNRGLNGCVVKKPITMPLALGLCHRASLNQPKFETDRVISSTPRSLFYGKSLVAKCLSTPAPNPNKKVFQSPVCSAASNEGGSEPSTRYVFHSFIVYIYVCMCAYAFVDVCMYIYMCVWFIYRKFWTPSNRNMFLRS